MYKQNPSPIAKKMLGDLNKDGKMSSYETNRQNAIEENMVKSPATMKGPIPLTKEQKDKANKEKRKKIFGNKVPPVAKKTIGPEGSKKTQRIRARVQKNEDKLDTTPINTKKEERLFKKDERLQKKLRKSKEKDKVKSVAKNYKKGYYGV